MSAVIFLGFNKETSTVPLVSYCNDKTIDQNVKVEVSKVILSSKVGHHEIEGVGDEKGGETNYAFLVWEMVL